MLEWFRHILNAWSGLQNNPVGRSALNSSVDGLSLVKLWQKMIDLLLTEDAALVFDLRSGGRKLALVYNWARPIFQSV